MSIKPGDIVWHKLAKEKMEILRIEESVATCLRIEQPKETYKSHITCEYVTDYPKAVCDVANLVTDLTSKPGTQLTLM